MERKFKYIQEGNTIRKVAAEPERRQVNAPQRIERPHRRTYRHAEEQTKMSLGMTMTMAVSVIVSVLICIHYLNVQSQVTELKDNISSLQTSLEDLVIKNDSIEYELDSYMDVDYIKQVAMDELGMVMANENQIITYDSVKNEYMEQYGDVPEK